jgi:hypothetical protein
MRTFALLLLLAGCPQEQFPLPMTAAELAAQDFEKSGPALVAYLGQPDATPAVCDLGSHGPHVPALDDKLAGTLVGGLADGKVPPDLWRRCANALLKSAPNEASRSWLDAVGKGYRKLLRDGDFEKRPDLQLRLSAMQRFYIERKNGFDGHEVVDTKLVDELRKALLNHRLGPAATSFGEELVEIVDLEHGLWLGRTVDLPMIDKLYAGGDAKTLGRIAARLPQTDLRAQAKRRVIRLHIMASPFDEVRQNAAAVEETLMKLGNNPISTAEHPPTRGWVQGMPMRGVLVRQDVRQQTAKLLGYSGDRPGLSVLPELKLRNLLLVEATGVSRPITLCAPSKELDPSPCVSVHDVTLDNPAAYLDKGGAFHFVEHITMNDALDLAQRMTRERFVLPVSVGGRRLTNFDWRLYYERPEDLIFSGPSPGERGPNLGVSVDHRDPNRYIIKVAGADRPYVALVESPDAPLFHVGSKGATGYTGVAGASGMSGMSGGECQSGSDGSNGGDGGPGGPGGDGGEVAVQVACGETPCQDVLALARGMVVSLAGDGGAGGSGGSGGSGGLGGPGRNATSHTDDNGTTVIDDPGCSAGSDGMSGMSGSNGSPGSPGHPGRVSFSATR